MLHKKYAWNDFGICKGEYLDKDNDLHNDKYYLIEYPQMDTFKYSDWDNTKYPNSELGRYRIYKTEEDAIKARRKIVIALNKFYYEEKKEMQELSKVLTDAFYSN
jgi:hypothetical protein